MKKLVAVLLILGLLTPPVSLRAAPPEFSGGVNNEYEYEEIVFLTGEPVKFTGTLTVSERAKTDGRTVSYRFKLTPADKSVKGKLDRTVTYVDQYTRRNDKGQTIAQTTLDRYSEAVEINGDKFELKDYQFSKSDVIDNRPASDFYSGNLKGRKVYTVNKTAGQVIVDITGGDVGYKNFWGSTETQVIDWVITARKEVLEDPEDQQNTNKITISWQGTVRIQASDSMTKTLQYLNNGAHYSSFDGGHARITNQDIVSAIEYDLPKMVDGRPDDRRRNQGTIQLAKEMVPRVERLIVPKFRDVGGHWAEEDIKKLYSLDVFDAVSQVFSPDTPMTREEFTRAIIRACNIRPAIATKTAPVRTTKKVAEKSPFIDVSVDDPNYEYIKEGLTKGIISGVSSGRFLPKGSLTRAQAITMLIRGLGFENRAPVPGFNTLFDDNRDIPDWAKDSIYMAREIGLVRGDNLNRVHPNDVMTRAEASSLLVRFLEFLQKDLQKDYRENIILF